MTAHDPLCPLTSPGVCGICEVIARVRAEYPTWPELVVQTRRAVAEEIAQAILQERLPGATFGNAALEDAAAIARRAAHIDSKGGGGSQRGVPSTSALPPPPQSFEP